MSKSLTILFTPMNYVGPINASIGIAQVLKTNGHRIVYAISADWKGKLQIYGFEEELIGEPSDDGEGEGSAQKNAEEVQIFFGSKSPLEKAKLLYNSEDLDEIETNEPLLEEIIKRVKPDVIVVDQAFSLPCILNSGVPWVWILSNSPLSYDWALDDDRVPPSFLGLPTDRPELWPKYAKELNVLKGALNKKYNTYLSSKGCKLLPEYKLLHPSPYLNCYMYPKELDYTDMRQLPENFHQFDCFMRTNDGNNKSFEFPENLKESDNKLILFSMGSMGGADIPLMKKLIRILAKSQHKFIVSKGPSGDEYELADNMWGQNSLPQIEILPKVDMVITHGGNNTVTECFYFGKPMIVLPIFVDQFDNAQRVQEKGFGLRLDPYECTEQQLLSSIDKLLNDQLLQQKLRTASERIQREDSLKKISKLIEKLVN